MTDASSRWPAPWHRGRLVQWIRRSRQPRVKRLPNWHRFRTQPRNRHDGSPTLRQTEATMCMLADRRSRLPRHIDARSLKHGSQLRRLRPREPNQALLRRLRHHPFPRSRPQLPRRRCRRGPRLQQQRRRVRHPLQSLVQARSPGSAPESSGHSRDTRTHTRP
jgi:hypothetical protein